jgi:hypothetical protein
VPGLTLPVVLQNMRSLCTRPSQPRIQSGSNGALYPDSARTIPRKKKNAYFILNVYDRCLESARFTAVATRCHPPECQFRLFTSM